MTVSETAAKTKTKTKTSKTDSNADCGWRVYSFGRRHSNFIDPETMGLSLKIGPDGDPIVVDPALRRKFKAGLAHFLSYYEHSGSWWGLKYGDIPAGIEFQWDGRRNAGLLIWDGPASAIPGTVEERTAQAAAFIDRYTKYVNGELTEEELQ